MDMKPNYKLYNELFSQAIRETLPSIDNDLYSCLPNDIGKAIERHKELCDEHGIDPITGEMLRTDKGHKTGGGNAKGFRCPVCGSSHIVHDGSYCYENGIQYPNETWVLCTECGWDSRDDDPCHDPLDDEF